MSKDADMAYTINEFCALFKLSKPTVYTEINSGRLRSYKVGRKRCISRQSAEVWQSHLESVSRVRSERT